MYMKQKGQRMLEPNIYFWFSMIELETQQDVKIIQLLYATSNIQRGQCEKDEIAKMEALDKMEFNLREGIFLKTVSAMKSRNLLA